eukprot:956370-Pelagomonas_calceolata.AAC.1
MHWTWTVASSAHAHTQSMHEGNTRQIFEGMDVRACVRTCVPAQMYNRTKLCAGAIIQRLRMAGLGLMDFYQDQDFSLATYKGPGWQGR